MSPQKVCQGPNPWYVHVEIDVTKLKNWIRDRPAFKVALNPTTTVLRGDRRGTDTDTQGEGHRRMEAEVGGTGPYSRQDFPRSTRAGGETRARLPLRVQREPAWRTVRLQTLGLHHCERTSFCGFGPPRCGDLLQRPQERNPPPHSGSLTTSTPAALPELPASSPLTRLLPLPFSHGPGERTGPGTTSGPLHLHAPIWNTVPSHT